MEILNQSVELIELKNWWLSNSNIWFDSTESDDINITFKYEYLMTTNFDEEIIIQNKELGIGYIILHDQITRHIARIQCYSDNYIFDNLNKIIGFVKKFYSKYCDDLEGYEFCFVLLPLRHSNDFEEQTFVMKETWKKIDVLSNPISESLIKIYKNYLKATYDRASRGSIYLDEYKPNNINLKEILDPRCIEHLEHPLNIRNNIIDKLEKLCECLKTKTNENKKYILSISGGVDSMVLAHILVQLKIDFVLVHINYANRGEICEKEKQLLSNWANIYQVELYIRDIYEINRPKCMKYDMRNLYEDYTRDVRYSTYCDVAKLKGWFDNNWYVLLGHNHDDCIENILTNISNKTKYNNLKGMEYETKINFVSNNSNNTINTTNTIDFIRPLLSISKEEIYQYADNQKITYLLDSTPHWSQRGKIRDIVRPGLIEWNQSSLVGLEELTNVIKESLECVELLASRWIEKIQPLNTLEVKEQVDIYDNKISMSSVKLNINVIKLNIREIVVNKIFWSKILEKIHFKSSSKSITMLVDKINEIKTKFDRIQIKQLSQIQINRNQKIYWWKINKSDLIFGFQ